MLDAVFIDPPYGEHMGYRGDNGLDEAEELLLKFLRGVHAKMKQNSYIAIFWTMRGLDICMDALRACGFTYRRTLSMYIPKGGARPHLGWLPRTQAIIIGQKYLCKPEIQFHKDLAEYLLAAINRSGITKATLAKRLNCDSRLVMKWTRPGDPAWCLPTPRFYRQLKEILGLDSSYDDLLFRIPVHDVDREFKYKHDTYVVDAKMVKVDHPSQKPLEVVQHIVQCIAPIDGLVFDGFSGSGTTALACRDTKRNFIATEISQTYCDLGNSRLLASCPVDKPCV